MASHLTGGGRREGSPQWDNEPPPGEGGVGGPSIRLLHRVRPGVRAQATMTSSRPAFLPTWRRATAVLAFGFGVAACGSGGESSGLLGASSAQQVGSNGPAGGSPNEQPTGGGNGTEPSSGGGGTSTGGGTSSGGGGEPPSGGGTSTGGGTSSGGGGEPPSGGGTSTGGGTSSGGAGGGTSGGGPAGPGGIGNPLPSTLDFKVTNEASTARTETIRASVPFPKGSYTTAQLANLAISGHQTAWLPLQLWADGTVKVAQAQFTDELQAGQSKTYTVASGVQALAGGFVRNAWVAQAAATLEFGAEVRDTFQVPYRAVASGVGEVLQATPLVQVSRHRTYHQPLAGQTGIGRDYLTSTFYVTEFRDAPYVVVDWVLGNDYLGADNVPTGNTDPNLVALGNADVRGAWFLFRGAAGCLPYRSQTEAISDSEAMAGGFSGHRVMTDTWLGDAQTRRYRFLLRCEDPNAAGAEITKWRTTADAMITKPCFAIASQAAWQATRAAGLVGGPIAGPTDAATRAAAELASWSATSANFGTWGSRGDALVTETTGTPRNHPLSPELAHAIQGNHPQLLLKLEQMAWAQAMRPYHLYGLQVGAEQQIILWDGVPMLIVPGEKLGRLRLRDQDPYPQYRTLSAGQPRAHGWGHFDHEHWSTDLLFDYWTISGDAWAQEELRQLGQSLKGLMRLTYYYTANIQAARAEGWCMQGFAQCYQATRDAALKTYAMRRVNEIVEPQRKKNHASKAMTFQGNYLNTGYPMNHEFFMPWQHGAVLYGYLGAYESFGEPLLRTIATDVVQTVAYSWVTNYQSPQFGFVAEGLRYYTPASHNTVPVAANYWDSLAQGVKFGDSPLGGAHGFLIGGLHLLAEQTPDPAVRTQALHYGGLLRGPVNSLDRWYKWNYCLPQQYAQ
jgi:hypothetical protein